jgi:hypothetical protein
VADRTIVLATNKRHAVRGLTVVNPQEFSAYQEDNDDLTYIVDMSSYLDGATISSVTRTPTGVTVSNTSNTTTRITQRLKGFGYVDFTVTTSSGDVEEFRIVIRSRTPSVYSQIASVPEATVNTLTENRTYYVRTDGSDGTSGLVNTSAGAFRTLQKALDTYAALDLAGFYVTIQLGDGTHTSGGILRATPVGATSALPLRIEGNSASPASCIISTTSSDCLKVENGALAYINGVELRTTSSGSGLECPNNGRIVWGTSMRFGACANYHMQATNGGILISSGGYTVSGNAQAHQHCTTNGYILVQSGTVTLSGVPAFSAYYIGINGAYVQYASTVAFSGTATGARWLVHDNAILYTGATFNASFFPGSTAGRATGGGIVDDVEGDVSHYTSLTNASVWAFRNTTTGNTFATLFVDSGSKVWFRLFDDTNTERIRLRPGDASIFLGEISFQNNAGSSTNIKTDNTGIGFFQATTVASKTGWATATGSATRTTFDTTTVTTAQLAERVKALIDDLHQTAGYGLLRT